MCVCVCLCVPFSNGKSVRGLKHTRKSFRGAFITSRFPYSSIIGARFVMFSYGIGILVFWFWSFYLRFSQIVALPTWSDLFVTCLLLFFCLLLTLFNF